MRAFTALKDLRHGSIFGHFTAFYIQTSVRVFHTTTVELKQTHTLSVLIRQRKVRLYKLKCLPVFKSVYTRFLQIHLSILLEKLEQHMKHVNSVILSAGSKPCLRMFGLTNFVTESLIFVHYTLFLIHFLIIPCLFMSLRHSGGFYRKY